MTERDLQRTAYLRRLWINQAPEMISECATGSGFNYAVTDESYEEAD